MKTGDNIDVSDFQKLSNHSVTDQDLEKVRKFINLNVYSRKDEKINNLRFYFKELEQQLKPLKSRKK